jgi:hypothetical protein
VSAVACEAIAAAAGAAIHARARVSAGDRGSRSGDDPAVGRDRRAARCDFTISDEALDKGFDTDFRSSW